MCNDHADLLKTIKQKVTESKKKSHREELVEILQNVEEQSQLNLRRCERAEANAKEEYENMTIDLDENLGYQRDYFQLLKRMQFEFERFQADS